MKLLEDNIRENVGDLEFDYETFKVQQPKHDPSKIILSWTSLKWKTAAVENTMLRKWKESQKIF